MTRNRFQKLAWILAGFVIMGIIIKLILWLRSLNGLPTLFDAVEALGWSTILPLVFSILAVMIINKQPGNKVAWLMLLVALTTSNPINIYFENLSPPSTTLTLPLFLMLWFDNWSWIPVIFPIFLIPLYFPTGRLPSPRWKWVPGLALGLWLFFMVVSLFVPEVGPINGGWGPMPNPIGFLPPDVLDGTFGILWGIGLLSIIGGSVLSLFVRYRRANSIERQQIKWLLYAGALFGTYYGLTFFLRDTGIASGWENFFFVASILTMPIAITIAILRYRLYDIDVIIRRTMVYAVLSAVLGLVYFGTVVLLQTLVGQAAGEQSPLVIVFSTLLIAALFSPLRRRIQAFIDRRFYRRKYDAAQILTQFAVTVRDEVELDQLTQSIQDAVQQTLEPAVISVWIPKPASKKRS